MGTYERKGNDLFYRQQNGEVTARLIDYEQKTELAHEGSRRYEQIFYLLAAVGIFYLVFIFATC